MVVEAETRNWSRSRLRNENEEGRKKDQLARLQRYLDLGEGHHSVKILAGVLERFDGDLDGQEEREEERSE